MAASVLGKRSRNSLSQAEVAPSSPCKKRNTRRSAPHIYEDADASPIQRTVNTRRHVTKRNTTIRRNVQNTTQNKRSISTVIEDVASASEEFTKENIPPQTETPSAFRFKDALSSSPATPKHRVKLGGKLLTPKSNRKPAVGKRASVYSAARQLFTQSSSACRLIGRDRERQCLQNFVSGAVEAQRGRCIYVSGPPGTGKSALVQELLEGFRDREHVQVSVVNCVTFRSSQLVLGKLSEDLQIGGSSSKTGKAVLGKAFTSNTNKRMSLVLMDEIDGLLDGDCDLLYNMFEWAMHPSSSLILIGIANALDLTDRFLPLLKARNLKPELLPFMPYTAMEMSNIVTQKLQSLLPANTTTLEFVPFLHPAAVQLIGKKIASQTGDLRKAFTLARRAIDQIEQESLNKLSSADSSPTKQPLSERSNMATHLPPTPPKSSPLKHDGLDSPTSSSSPEWTIENAPRATIGHVAKLASSIFNNGAVSRLCGLNLQQKTVLCSLVANEERQQARDPFKTPSKSAKKIPTIKDLFEKYTRLCQKDEGLLHPLKITEFRDVVASLETLGLVHESVGRSSSFLTPSKTPSRTGKNIDDKQVVSAVSVKEMKEGIQGPGSDLLQRLFDE